MIPSSSNDIYQYIVSVLGITLLGCAMKDLAQMHMKNKTWAFFEQCGYEYKLQFESFVGTDPRTPFLFNPARTEIFFSP